MDQLEKTQKNLHSIKQQYEEKMQVLQQQIKSIEVERDKMLKEIGMLDLANPNVLYALIQPVSVFI